MKKRILSVVLCVCLLLSFTACKKEEEPVDDSRIYYGYEDLSEYIKLGDYKGLEVKLFDTSATEEEINSAAESWFKSQTFTETVDKTAENGDIVNIDYVGTMDGEAFQGGTAKDQEFTLGQASFIDGFQEGVVGMKAGESKDLNLTFPDPYENNPDFAGKPAVFTITLNAVKKTVEGELTDSFLGKYSEDYKTVADLKEAQKASIEAGKQSAESNQNINSTLQAVMEKAEIKSLPERELNKAKESIKKTVENYYNQYTAYGYFSGTTEEFIKAFFGAEEVESADAYYAEQAEEQTRMELILAAIAKAEGLTVSDEEYNELADAYADYQYESKEAFLENVGGEGYLRWYLLYNKTMEYLMANTTFLDKDGNVTVYPSPTPEPEPTSVPEPTENADAE
jgi:trigger factor